MHEVIWMAVESNYYSLTSEYWNWGEIRIEASAQNGVFTIYAIYGYKKTGSNRSYSLGDKYITVGVNGDEQRLYIANGIDFGKPTGSNIPVDWVADEFKYTGLPAGPFTVSITMPYVKGSNGEPASFSEKVFKKTITMVYPDFIKINDTRS